MKRDFCIFIGCLLVFFLAGCAGTTSSDVSGDADITQSNLSAQTDDAQSSAGFIVQAETIPLSELKVDSASVKEAVSGFSNWTVSDELVIDVPKEIECLYDFGMRYASRQSNKDFYEDFLEAFEYLFPEQEIKEECFFYYGENSRPEFTSDGELVKWLNLVKDYYDEIMSDEENLLYFYYEDKDEMIFEEFTSPIGNDLSRFNKGVAQRLAGREDYGMEGFEADEYFDSIGSYSPDSEVSFKLLDGEMRICDAVEFFENYIANIPGGEEATTKPEVIGISVLDLENGCYGYSFETSISYNGIMFDYFPMNVSYQESGSRYFVSGSGTMVRTDDVDHIYGIGRMKVIEDEEKYSELISLEDAVEAIHSKLTQEVEFKLCRVELVYSMPNTPEGTGLEPEEYLLTTKTAWKLTLVNENDSRAYICYVNARDGQDFSYFTTEVEQ